MEIGKLNTAQTQEKKIVYCRDKDGNEQVCGSALLTMPENIRAKTWIEVTRCCYCGKVYKQ